MDIAHTELWREALGPYSKFKATGHEFVVAEASVRFRDSACFDDKIDVEVVVEALTTTSMTTLHFVRRDKALLVEGKLRHVCVDAATYAKVPWPDAVRRTLAPFVRAGCTG